MKLIDIMITIIFIVQPLWRLGWRTSRCSDTSSPISLMSGLSHRWADNDDDDDDDGDNKNDDGDDDNYDNDDDNGE